MPGTFRCSNPQCPNRERGVHLTSKAAMACASATPVTRGPLSAGMFAPANAARKPMSLSDLSEAHSLGELTDDDILLMSDFASLDEEGKDLLLDLVATDSPYADEHASGESLVDYVAEAQTGHTSLTEWAEEQMNAQSNTAVPGESPEHYAESALVREIWVLPRRDNPEQYRVMRRI